MVKFNLTPRLNYNYSLKDVYVSLKSLNKDDLYFQKIYDLFRTTNIYFTNHARTGLRLLLNSLNLPRNAHIGVQAYNCHTVFQSIKQAGYQAIFIDIQKHLTISIDDLKNKNDSIDALIVTHIFGIPADFDEIKEIVKDKPIIEDCAHSFLSEYKGQYTGLLGDAAIFSFGQAKFPSIGDGGFVIINNKKISSKFFAQYNCLDSPNLFQELKNVLKNFLASFMHKRPVYGIFTFPILKKLESKLDFMGKFKFDETKAFKSNMKLFLNKFQYYFSYLNKQQENGKKIIHILEKVIDPSLVYKKDNIKVNYFMLPFLTKNRKNFIKHFYRNNVEVGIHFGNSLQWAKRFGYKNGDCPNTEKIIEEIFCVPCHYKYPLKEIEKNLSKVVFLK